MRFTEAAVGVIGNIGTVMLEIVWAVNIWNQTGVKPNTHCPKSKRQRNDKKSKK